MQVTKEKYGKYIEENKRRRDEMFSPYDPFKGIGSPIPRKRIVYTVGKQSVETYFPQEMYDKSRTLRMLFEKKSIEGVIRDELGSEPTGQLITSLMSGLNETRLDYDFEYWAITAVKIQDKESKEFIPFRLNRGQRRLLEKLEKMRLAGKPIRIIVCKARQWGSSTFTQLYMAWIQIRKKKNWHSAVVTDVQDQAKNIRAMFTRMAKEYPEALGTITLQNFEGSTNNKLIKERGSIMGMGSIQQPDSLRSFDFAMLMMSEVGMWKTTEGRSPEEMAQSLRASVPSSPLSMIVLESTAKGVGNFFHREWLKAINKESGYEPVFVPWWEIERYQRKPRSLRKLVNFVDKDEYAQYLWEIGATLEGIEWYFYTKKAENYDDLTMGREFPSSWQESFQSTGQRVFPPSYVQYARSTCEDPEAIGDLTADSHTGEKALDNIDFFKDPKGLLKVWQFPDREVKMSDRYVIFVDIGGTTKGADWSVIKVFDRYWMAYGGSPEVVAVWRGHIDQDLVAWKAAQMGKWYNDALVAVETNSLNTEEDTEGVHHLTILDEIVDHYPNLYTRTDPQKVREGLPVQWGFHTNISTKTMIINALKKALREKGYYERDLLACDEMDTFEIKPNKKMGAVDGCKDDNVIVTAGGVWLCFEIDLPVEIRGSGAVKQKKAKSEASF